MDDSLECLTKKVMLTCNRETQDKGVETAIQNIYRDLEYAKSLIKRKMGPNDLPDAEGDDETEESWTFIGSDEPDPDMVTKKLSEGLGGVGLSEQKGLGRKFTKA